MIAKVKEVLLESLESESGYIRGGDDLLAALSDGGILEHIHDSLANLNRANQPGAPNGISLQVKIKGKGELFQQFLTFLGVSTVLGTHSLTGVRTQEGALTCP